MAAWAARICGFRYEVLFFCLAWTAMALVPWPVSVTVPCLLYFWISGGDGGWVTPVPFPNTVVKTPCADGTWPAWPGRVGAAGFLPLRAPVHCSLGGFLGAYNPRCPTDRRVNSAFFLPQQMPWIAACIPIGRKWLICLIRRCSSHPSRRPSVSPILRAFLPQGPGQSKLYPS